MAEEPSLPSELQYLLDTNALSEPTKPIPNREVAERIQANLPLIATAATVWDELLFGYFRLPNSERRTALEIYLFGRLAPKITILPFDQSAAEWHAFERARLSRIGRTPPFEDGQIAAVAYVNDLTLVTANTRDFQNFQGLQVEDWSQ